MAFGGRSQLKMSEETFDFVCTACVKKGKTIEAVKYCVECGGYCCQSCTDVHTMFPALENHNLMAVNQGKQSSGQSSSLPEFPTERCYTHTGKVLDMYCEGHDVVGCSTCFVKDHKFCQDNLIHSIPDMIDTIYKLSDCKQTQRLVKDMVVSMETICQSKETQLQSLNEAKKEALNEVTIFQKALEAIVRKAADASREQVEAAYTDLKNEILQEKHKAENICANLKTTDEKLNVAEGNRAQRFVCTKIGQEMIEKAESEKMIQEVHQKNINLQISFHPDQSLMEYVKAVECIGQVQKHGQQKLDLYRIKGSRDIITQLSNDSMKCYSRGCCLTHDNQLLVTDYYNKKLKLVDMRKLSVVDHCTLDSEPNGVCCISKHEVAVACGRNKIQFVSIQKPMIPTRQIKTSLTHECYGIAFNDGKLYVTDNDAVLYMYDLMGTLLKTISKDKDGNKLFKNSSHIAINESGNRMFVGDGYNNRLACFDGMGNYLSTTKDTDLSYADGVCVDGRGNVFVVGWKSHNVVQYRENGEKVGVVVKRGDGLQDPISVCFHQGLNRLFVTLNNRSEVKMYELE